MSWTRLISPLLLPSLLLIACGDSETERGLPGDHFIYVAERATVPTSAVQSAELGLDLDGNKAVDNRLGEILATFATQGLDAQGAVNLAIDQGDTLLLLDVETQGFDGTNRAGLKVMVGDRTSAMPAPCASPTDTVCRKHLDGNGSFKVAAGSESPQLLGKLINGDLTAGPGNYSFSLSLSGTQPIQLDLIGARAKLTGVGDGYIDSVILAGALTKEIVDTRILPVVHAQLAKIVQATCLGSPPPGCGCVAGSRGKTILTIFDTNQNCMLTLDEIKSNSLLGGLLTPDVTIDGTPALSFGMEISAVKAAIR
jgi:hypothetical protein